LFLFPLILNKNHALVAADLPNKEEKESNPHPTIANKWRLIAYMS
jgi:hypothetical protein